MVIYIYSYTFSKFRWSSCLKTFSKRWENSYLLSERKAFCVFNLDYLFLKYIQAFLCDFLLMLNEPNPFRYLSTAVKFSAGLFLKLELLAPTY